MLIEAFAALLLLNQVNKKSKSKRRKKYVNPFDKPAKWRNGRQFKLKRWFRVAK